MQIQFYTLGSSTFRFLLVSCSLILSIFMCWRKIKYLQDNWSWEQENPTLNVDQSWCWRVETAAEVKFQSFAHVEWGIFDLQIMVEVCVLSETSMSSQSNIAWWIGGLAWMKMTVLGIKDGMIQKHWRWIMVKVSENCLRL